MKCAAVVGYAQKRIAILNFEVAPEVGLEPTTYWLTANRSTIELLRNTEGRKT